MPARKRPHKVATEPGRSQSVPAGFAAPGEEKKRLDLVFKCDSMGSLEAVSAVISKMKLPEAEIKVIHEGVGTISKQDLLMALAGSRLVLGFQVQVAPRLDQWVKEHGVEVRLYNVIYQLIEDLKEIAQQLVQPEPEETVTGKCKVIAVFKSKKGEVLGCEVETGTLQVGKNFRVVTAMGPVHSSRIESLQIEKNPVKEARYGQQVGVKVAGYMGAKVGDYIECFETGPPKKRMWSPEGRILHLEAS